MIKKGVDENAQARKSALLVAAVLALFAAWNFYRGRMTVVAVLGGISLALLVVGLFVPPLARGFHRAWMRLAGILGYINSRILLFLMFYGILTPYGIISRLLGRDVLNRRARGQESYWITRPKTRQTKEGFERLF
ncbi:MAG TPA: SxtJ family membrane protein [Pyrinomonadaceae bacterium]|nr:SxtJ family membrane protein [Pyrinomonadaceae bacterium]